MNEFRIFIFGLEKHFKRSAHNQQVTYQMWCSDVVRFSNETLFPFWLLQCVSCKVFSYFSSQFNWNEKRRQTNTTFDVEIPSRNYLNSILINYHIRTIEQFEKGSNKKKEKNTWWNIINEWKSFSGTGFACIQKSRK